jgi:hypothetical protein
MSAEQTYVRSLERLAAYFALKEGGKLRLTKGQLNTVAGHRLMLEDHPAKEGGGCTFHARPA